jgi:MFS transporter, SP family, sugar:H+ symporter
MYQLQIIIGIFVSYVIEIGSHTINGSASWRVPVGLQMLWGLILLSGIFFLPESPRHSLGRGREEEAKATIASLNGVSVNDPLVAELVDELEYSIRAENEGGKATWAECFGPRNVLWKRTMNGMMLQFIQQLNGQNFYCEPSMTYYLPSAEYMRLLQTTMAIRSSRALVQRCHPTPSRPSLVAYLS